MSHFYGSSVFHPPTQETMDLAVEECVNARDSNAMINVSRFGGFRSSADDPPRSLGACAPKRYSAQGRRWVWFWGTTGLPVGLHR